LENATTNIVSQAACKVGVVQSIALNPGSPSTLPYTEKIGGDNKQKSRDCRQHAGDQELHAGRLTGFLNNASAISAWVQCHKKRRQN
jgi:hypothetical protein